MEGHPTREVIFQDLGLVDYGKAFAYQTALLDQIVSTKKKNREAGTQERTNNYLLFCEHPHVYTLGRSGDEKHLLLPQAKLSELKATFHTTNRGGDITYHGPGQVVVYPVLDLENFFTDISRYMRTLEEAVIGCLLHFGITAGRVSGLTGVWVDVDHKPRKICAMGVKSSRWVTMHGLALNVNTDLAYFSNIVPCGIPDKPVTSMQQELGSAVNLAQVKDVLKASIATQFEMSLKEGPHPTLPLST